MDHEKPSILIGDEFGRRTRWWPHEALARLALHGAAPDMNTGEEEGWRLLTREDAARWLPTLRENARGWARFTAMIEAIAEGRPAVTCEVCSTRFYPSRSDARYCSGRCRTRAYRKG